jgi:hypothetical protein
VGITEGHQIFVDALTRFAVQSRNPRLTPIIRRFAVPVRVAVRGRDGPTLTVLNKADLTGLGGRGPLALAHRRAAGCRALTGVPTVPMVALPATADLDDELASALRALVRQPADLTSTDEFVPAEHPLPRKVRRRLLDPLDRFGIAHAVLAIGEAADAPVRYRRLRSTIAELHTLAVQSGDNRPTEFLSADDTVLAVRTAPVDVVEAAGVRIDSGGDPGSHLRGAAHWRRYGRGPVDAFHLSCATDITRGSLRLFGRVR